METREAVCEAHVLRLEVPVVDAVRVAVRERGDYLQEEELGVLFREAGAFGDAVKELAPSAQLHDHVHAFLVHVHLERGG